VCFAVGLFFVFNLFSDSFGFVCVCFPSLVAAPAAQRRALFLRKLDQCQIVFDFLDDDEQDAVMSREREKELKREVRPSLGF
jgi:hypothetical protein